MYLHWVLELGQGDRPTTKLPAEVIDAIGQRMRANRYRYDDPLPADRIDDQWFWSENHVIIGLVNEYLAGQRFADGDLRGHRADRRPSTPSDRGRAILEWIDERARFGFFEWHSNVYMLKNITPAAHPGRAGRRRRAGPGGRHGARPVPARHGRAPPCRDVHRDPGADLQEGQDDRPPRGHLRHGQVRVRRHRAPLPVADRHRRHLLLRSRRLPPARRRWSTIATARGTGGRARAPRHLRGRRRAGDRTTRGAVRLRLRRHRQPHVLVVAGRGRHVAGRRHRPRRGRRAPAVRGAELRADQAALADLNGGDPDRIKAWEQANHAIVNFGHLREANTYAWRGDSVSLATVVDHRFGQMRDQVHAWQATDRRPGAGLHDPPGTRPAGVHRLGRGRREPGYWTGEASMPRSAQFERTAVHIYQPAWDEQTDALLWSVFGYRPFTHAYVPQDRFDEVVQRGHWTVARKGEGWHRAVVVAGADVADLRPGPPRHRRDDEAVRPRGRGRARQRVGGRGGRRSGGAFRGWLDDGDRVAARRRARRPTGSRCAWTSPSAGEITFGSTGPFTVAGEEASRSPTSRATSRRSGRWTGLATRYRLRTDGARLDLDFRTGDARGRLSRPARSDRRGSSSGRRRRPEDVEQRCDLEQQRAADLDGRRQPREGQRPDGRVALAQHGEHLDQATCRGRCSARWRCTFR